MTLFPASTRDLPSARADERNLAVRSCRGGPLSDRTAAGVARRERRLSSRHEASHAARPVPGRAARRGLERLASRGVSAARIAREDPAGGTRVVGAQLARARRSRPPSSSAARARGEIALDERRPRVAASSHVAMARRIGLPQPRRAHATSVQTRATSTARDAAVDVPGRIGRFPWPVRRHAAAIGSGRHRFRSRARRRCRSRADGNVVRDCARAREARDAGERREPAMRTRFRR